jgi:hypothetical protein
MNASVTSAPEPRTGRTLRIALPRPAQVVRGLAGLMLLLITFSIGGQLVRHRVGYESVMGLIDKFYVDAENNVPAYFSGLLLLLTAGLLSVAARYHATSPYRLHWKGLAWLFVLLSIDEISSFHEIITDQANRYLILPGALQFAWVIPGGIFLAFVGLAYLRFLSHLPALTRRGMLLAGGIFVTGAIGVEVLGSYYYSLHGRYNLAYSFIATLEETLEMTGVIVFIHTLLTYLSKRLSDVTLQRSPVG